MVENLGAELVAEDGIGAGIEAVVRAAATAAEIHQSLHVVQGMEVGAADAAGQRPDQNLPLSRLQVRDLS